MEVIAAFGNGTLCMPLAAYTITICNLTGNRFGFYPFHPSTSEAFLMAYIQAKIDDKSRKKASRLYSRSLLFDLRCDCLAY
ncbi:hypothetical protein V6N13_125414 [Hibiscus sabdariffa]